MSQLAQSRPRAATEIIDASFRFYRAHFGELAVVSALLLVPLAIVSVLSPDWLRLIMQFVTNFAYLVVQGAIALFVGAAVERDQRLRASEVYAALGQRAGTVIAVSFLSGLMVGVGFLLLIVPAFIAFVWTAAALPVAAIEGPGAMESMRRSRELARGQFWHVLGTMVLMWIIVMALVLGAAIALGVVLGMFGIPERVTDMLGVLLMVFLFPLISVTATLLYYDLRVRTDGADVAAMMEGLGVAD